MYLVFTRTSGESYRRRLRSLMLYLCYVFRALINSLVLIKKIKKNKKNIYISVFLSQYVNERCAHKIQGLLMCS